MKRNIRRFMIRSDWLQNNPSHFRAQFQIMAQAPYLNSLHLEARRILSALSAVARRRCHMCKLTISPSTSSSDPLTSLSNRSNCSSKPIHHVASRYNELRPMMCQQYSTKRPHLLIRLTHASLRISLHLPRHPFHSGRTSPSPNVQFAEDLISHI